MLGGKNSQRKHIIIVLLSQSGPTLVLPAVDRDNRALISENLYSGEDVAAHLCRDNDCVFERRSDEPD